MQVEITQVYRVAPEGHTTYTYQPGDIVTGLVAELALADKVGKKLQPKRTPAPRKTKPADGPEHEG